MAWAWAPSKPRHGQGLGICNLYAFRPEAWADRLVEDRD